MEYIAPNGKLAIVLPDGLLANSSMQDVRDWILRWTRLKAVLSLPQETFTPYGAGVKSSILVLEKRAIALAIGEQIEINQIVVEEKDYKVYMARIDDIGYDASGRLKVKEEEASFPYEVESTINKFHEKLGWCI